MDFVWDLLRYYGNILACTVGVLILSGLLSWLFCRLFTHLVGGHLGHRAVMWTAWIGTPVHEIGHALMCLLFGHRITEMRLYSPNSETNTLGYVSHSYHPRNVYHQLGNLCIGLGPIFSGGAVMTGILFLAFPGAVRTFFADAFADIGAGGSFGTVILDGLHLIPDLFTCDGKVWLKIIGFVVMFAVALHINLSPADIRGSLRGLGVYAILALLFAAVTQAIGTFAFSALVSIICEGLHIFALYSLAIFMVIYMVDVCLIAVAAVFFVLRLICSRFTS